jgi:hypothetical protein
MPRDAPVTRAVLPVSGETAGETAGESAAEAEVLFSGWFWLSGISVG